MGLVPMEPLANAAMRVSAASAMPAEPAAKGAPRHAPLASDSGTVSTASMYAAVRSEPAVGSSHEAGPDDCRL